MLERIANGLGIDPPALFASEDTTLPNMTKMAQFQNQLLKEVSAAMAAVTGASSQAASQAIIDKFSRFMRENT
jgi:hypothetical protein